MRTYNTRMKRVLILALARPLLNHPAAGFASVANSSGRSSAFVVWKIGRDYRPNRSLSNKQCIPQCALETKRSIRGHYSFPIRTTSVLFAKPKKAGSVVDGYQTVSVNCNKCKERLFRYKKKNGTKSNLVKCYVERISEDCVGILALAAQAESRTNHKNENQKKELSTAASTEDGTVIAPKSLDPEYSWECPKCNSQFARSSLIHGRPALKMIGGKIRMTKK